MQRVQDIAAPAVEVVAAVSVEMGSGGLLVVYCCSAAWYVGQRYYLAYY